MKLLNEWGERILLAEVVMGREPTFSWVTEIITKWCYLQGYYNHLMLVTYETKGDMLCVN